MTTTTVEESNSAFFSTAVRPRLIFSVAQQVGGNLFAEMAPSDQLGGEEESDIALSSLTGNLASLDFVWRPLVLQSCDLLSKNIRKLSYQLQHAIPFVRFVSKTLNKEHERSENRNDEQIACFAMLYNKYNERVRSVQVEDGAEMESFSEDESGETFQWTAVVAATISKSKKQVVKTTMVLKAPDSVESFTKESLINILDIAETIGCEKILVAVNKDMLPSSERTQILKAFMYVGFEMVHPRTMSVDNHVLLGYDL